MTTILGGSIAFSVGAAFMKSSHGSTRLLPTLAVLLSFSVGAVLLTKAVRLQNTSTTIVMGLGLEAIITVALGICLLGEKLSVTQAAGLFLVLSGIVMVRL